MFGQGYGTEITRLVMGFALSTVGLHRVSLGVYDFNPRAQRVYEKCGFRHEGRLRETLHWDGQWHDELLMAILHNDPRPDVDDVAPTERDELSIDGEFGPWRREDIERLQAEYRTD